MADQNSSAPPPVTSPADDAPPRESKPLTDSKGWDGKLRIERKVEVQNSASLSDDENAESDDEVVPDQIAADEGSSGLDISRFLCFGGLTMDLYRLIG